MTVLCEGREHVVTGCARDQLGAGRIQQKQAPQAVNFGLGSASLISYITGLERISAKLLYSDFWGIQSTRWLRFFLSLNTSILKTSQSG